MRQIKLTYVALFVGLTLLWLLVLLLGIAVIAHLRLSPVPARALTITTELVQPAGGRPSRM